MLIQAIGDAFGWLQQYWFLINILLAVVIVFFQRKEPESVWAWLMLLFLMPVFGFFFYLLLHYDFHKRKMFYLKELQDEENSNLRLLNLQQGTQDKEPFPPTVSPRYIPLVRYNREKGFSLLVGEF